MEAFRSRNVCLSASELPEAVDMLPSLLFHGQMQAPFFEIWSLNSLSAFVGCFYIVHCCELRFQSCLGNCFALWRTGSDFLKSKMLVIVLVQSKDYNPIGSYTACEKIIWATIFCIHTVLKFDVTSVLFILIYINPIFSNFYFAMFNPNPFILCSLWIEK